MFSIQKYAILRRKLCKDKTSSNMATIWHGFNWMVLILTVFCLNCSKAEITSKEIYLNPNNFERLKLSIFTTQQRSELESDEKCLNDLKEIGNNLGEEWAMRSKLNFILNLRSKFRKMSF